MSISRLEKRARIETSLVKIPKTHKEFTITINTDKLITAGHSSVSFKYTVNGEGPYIKNGHLNLSAALFWEISLSGLEMPNNFITFPSISAEGNLNAAYFVMTFDIQYELAGVIKHRTVRLPYFLEHKKFTTGTLIKDIFSGIADIFAYACSPNTIGINLAKEVFITRCFHLYIDSRSKYSRL